MLPAALCHSFRLVYRHTSSPQATKLGRPALGQDSSLKLSLTNLHSVNFSVRDSWVPIRSLDAQLYCRAYAHLSGTAPQLQFPARHSAKASWLLRRIEMGI